MDGLYGGELMIAGQGIKNSADKLLGHIARGEGYDETYSIRDDKKERIA